MAKKMAKFEIFDHIFLKSLHFLTNEKKSWSQKPQNCLAKLRKVSWQQLKSLIFGWRKMAKFGVLANFLTKFAIFDKRKMAFLAAKSFRAY